MYILSNVWFLKLIRQFFFWIDKIVFGLIPTIYQLLTDIARTSILSQASLASIGERIYELLAIFMIFKIIFSLIMYVVNPDDFSDNSKGISKLGTNVVISLALLILVPYIFSYAYQLQTYILEDNALGNLIFGSTKDDGADSSFYVTAGDEMAFTLMQPFFLPNTALNELKNCVTLTDNENEVNEDCSGLNFLSDDIYNGDEETLAGLANKNDGNDSNYSQDDVANYVYGVERKSLGLMFRQNMAIATSKVGVNNEDEFVMEYKAPFSTVVGIVAIILLVSFCMDVAIRSIKLSFLQLIAPIPILSYIDPKQGKDGMFKKWYQMCFKTFASLFVRLLALYFAVFIISKIDRMSDIINGSYQSSIWVKIFVIIGALMFAKQLPKMLEGLGIKLDGDGKFTLNPLKRFEEEAIGGKRIAGMAGAMTAGTIERGARIFSAAGAKGKLKAAVGTPFGILGAGFRGFRNNSGFKGGLNKQAEVNRRLRESRINGLSPTAGYLDYVGSQFGLDNATLEKESTLVKMNEENIGKKKREIASATRDKELSIKTENEKMKHLKSVQDRRGAVKSAGENLKNQAEDFAKKKADFKKTNEDVMRLEAIDKIKKGRYSDLSVDQANYLRSEGISLIPASSDPNTLAEREAKLAVLERKANSNQYTTNRKTDDANVDFLRKNQGTTLDRAIVIGEGDGQVVLAAGTYIDGSVVAQAETAQGKYVKSSQVAVFNELAKGENSEYADGDDYAAFQRSLGVYEDARETSNRETNNYSGNNAYGMTLRNLESDKDNVYDQIDDVIHKVENSEDTRNITRNLNNSSSEVEKLEKAIADIKANATVDYYDEKGHKVEGTRLDKAESMTTPRREKVDSDKKKHDERLSNIKGINSSGK